MIGGKVRLFDLPQELQDIIFELAFSNVSNLRLTFKGDWDKDERRKKKFDPNNYTMKAFPRYKVDEWMVSKRFLLAAAKAWMGAQTFDAPDEDYKVASSYSFELIVRSKLYRDFAAAARLTCDSYMIQRASQLRCLRRLTIVVGDDIFDVVPDKFAWEDHFDDTDFCLVAEAAEFCLLKQLPAVSLEPKECEFATTQDKKRTWERNVRFLETYLERYLQYPSKCPEACEDDEEEIRSEADVLSGSKTAASDATAKPNITLLLGPSLAAASPAKRVEKPDLLATLTSTNRDHAESLEGDKYPLELRCGFCGGIAYDAVGTPCCNAVVCSYCQAFLPFTCRECGELELTSENCPVDESLRKKIKARLEGEVEKCSVTSNTREIASACAGQLSPCSAVSSKLHVRPETSASVEERTTMRIEIVPDILGRVPHDFSAQGIRAPTKVILATMALRDDWDSSTFDLSHGDVEFKVSEQETLGMSSKIARIQPKDASPGKPRSLYSDAATQTDETPVPRVKTSVSGSPLAGTSSQEHERASLWALIVSELSDTDPPHSATSDIDVVSLEQISEQFKALMDATVRVGGGLWAMLRLLGKAIFYDNVEYWIIVTPTLILLGIPVLLNMLA